jgi:L-fucose mutarotase/ribose pyranase (RbsD/FucU family)
MEVNDGKKIVEGFGGFLNTAKQFISGVGKGSFDNTLLASKEKPDQDFPASIYSAEVLRGALINTANAIDNILSGMNPADVENAKASASEMINFIRNSFTQIQEIINDGGSGKMTNQKMNSTISEISKKLDVITRSGGVLQKWKDEFLGVNNEKLAGKEYLDKGRSLMEKGRDIMKQVGNVNKLKDKIESTDLESIIDRSLAELKGGDKRPMKPGEVRIFSKNKKDQDPSVIKEYRERLDKLGLKSKDTEGIYGSDDQEKTKQAMQYIGSVNGKVYADSDEALQDFQKDLGVYVSKQDDIKKLIIK